MTERRRVPVSDDKQRSAEPAGEPGECKCPRLDSDDWHEVESDWSDIAFLRASTGAVLGVPTGYDSARSGLLARAKKLGATVPDDAMLLLGSGRFRRPIMLEVENVPEGALGVVRPGGVAYSRLVPAPWGRMQQAVDETRDAAREKYGREPDDTWIWYVTCRTCSRERNFETLIIAHYNNEQP